LLGSSRFFTIEVPTAELPVLAFTLVAPPTPLAPETLGRGAAASAAAGCCGTGAP
jgi:hypothetical protein